MPKRQGARYFGRYSRMAGVGDGHATVHSLRRQLHCRDRTGGARPRGEESGDPGSGMDVKPVYYFQPYNRSVALHDRMLKTRRG
jgi:hypothetical protein